MVGSRWKDILCIGTLLFSCGANAFMVDVFGPDTYDSDVVALNVNLGFSDDMVFEDFDDLSWQPGVSVSTDATVFETFEDSSVWDVSWQGETSLMANGFSHLSFNFEDAIDSFGIGLSGTFYENTTMLINNNVAVNLSDFVDWRIHNHGRNGYVRVDSLVGGEAISSIAFLPSVPRADGVFFDHLAFRTVVVSEPQTIQYLLFILMFAAYGVSEKKNLYVKNR